MGLIHIIGAYIPTKFSIKTIDSFHWLYPVKQWELSIYNKLQIKRWKDKVPDGGDWVKGGIKKRNIKITNQEGLSRLYLETKRAELSHWLQIIPAPIFFTFNDLISGSFMIFYAFCFNLPFIIIQRYNRKRIEGISDRFIMRF